MQILKMGSSGPAVLQLQKALNVASKTGLQLTPDGQFGARTHGRVVEFQRSKALVTDGIVGPKTHQALDAFYKLIGKVVDELPAPPGEAAARKRIVATATQFQQVHGWRPNGVVGATNPRIAANKCADASTRARQGGAALSTIWSVAGVGSPPPQRCLTISPVAETNYASGANGRNQWDLPSWCGIFALAMYKLSGLKMSSWPLKHTVNSSSPELRPVMSPAQVRPGDLGIFDFRPGHTNHHFLVVGVSGDRVESVEGNVTFGPGTQGFQTVVQRSKFGVKQIFSDPFSAFVSPIWERVI